MITLSTVAAFGFADFDPPEILGLYRRLGCVSCQFYRNEQAPPGESEVLSVCGAARLPVDSIHGVFGDRYDPTSPDAAVRDAALATYEAEGRLAARLGGPVVVVHPSRNRRPDESHGETQRLARFAVFKRFAADLAEVGRRLKVVYLVENQPPIAWYGSDATEMAAVVREVDSPWLRMCLDLGHAHLTGDPVAAIHQCADVTAYLHIHDNDGQSDSHQMPGDGRMDWRAIGEALAMVQLNAPAMLEVFYTRHALEQALASGLAAKFKQWLNLTRPLHA